MTHMIEATLVPNLIESNGKTIRQNNLERPHAIPLKTLVEIVVAVDDDYCMDKYRGVRAYVVTHERDCDGTPLYGLSQNRDVVEDEAVQGYTDPQIKALVESLYRAQINSGHAEEGLRIIDLKREEWQRAPGVGMYVVANHPITPANPSRIFRVAFVDSSNSRIYARGKHTMGFSVDMLRPPTPEELANLANFHPSEI